MKKDHLTQTIICLIGVALLLELACAAVWLYSRHKTQTIIEASKHKPDI